MFYWLAHLTRRLCMLRAKRDGQRQHVDIIQFKSKKGPG